MMERFPAPMPENPDPAAGLFFTNYSFHYQLENPADPEEYLMIVPRCARHPVSSGWVFDGLQAAFNHYGNIPLIEVEEVHAAVR